ncbi:hypothetical protein BKA83DRAFT_22553 [Pisolithus microcarpus]|nr:hypothetical protein BKA83DRAFT_22553 [Pisolithus microcarpus]
MSIKPVVAPSPADVFKGDIFQGKVLFCTGGGSGICKAMTEAIVRADPSIPILTDGLNIFKMHSRKPRIGLSQATGQTRPVAMTIERFGRIDFVICGAAGTVVEIDTLGTFNTVKATLPCVRASRGAYIHVSSTLHYKGTPYQAHVSAAKAGVDAFSAVLALEEGPKGVRSNVIAPGAIADTEGMSRLSNQMSRSINSPLPYPLGRAGEVQDVASAAVFLFSHAASVLAVDGGYEHVRASQLPYPQAVLDPESIKQMVRGKL